MTDIGRSLSTALAAYVPSTLIERLVTENPPVLGQTEHLEGVALLADLSGFTQLSERLAKYGQQGAEELAAQLNAILSKLINHVYDYGGDVVSFGGDSLMAVFFGKRESPKLAVSCALMMQAEVTRLGTQEIFDEQFGVSIKIGLGKGPLTVMHVGHIPQPGEDPTQTWREIIFAGEAIERATAAEHRAARGNVVADKTMAMALGEIPPGLPLDAGFMLLEDVLPLRPPTAISQIHADAETLRPYMLLPVLRRLEAGDGHPPADLRRVTNMFVMFHGLDYNRLDAAEQLESYVTVAGDIIRAHGGSIIAILTGDKGSRLHVVFGAPLAHENIERRAVRCALALMELESQAITEQQIGIASGRVFAGPTGSDLRREYTVVGDAVNFSARLTSLAGHGNVLLDENTYVQVQENFVAEAHHNVRVKGKAQPQSIYRVTGVRKRKGTLQTHFLLSQRSMVERDAEMTIVKDVVARALDGESQILIVTGTSGIGKTRLLEEVIRLWLPHGQGFGGECPPHTPRSDYVPWTPIWRELLLPDSGSKVTLQERLSALCPDHPMAMHVLGPNLGLDVDLLPATNAPTQQAQLFAIVAEMLQTVASQTALMLVFSNMHWSDEPTQRLIEHVAATCLDVPLLLCIEHRPHEELLPGLDSNGRVRRLELSPLSGEAGWRLIDEMTHDMPRHRWPEALRDELEQRLGISQNAVNPLFVKESLNAMLQSGVLVPDHEMYQVESINQLRIPDRVNDILMTRFDTLDETARTVLRVASVIESPIPLPVLADAYPQPISEAELRRHIDKLEGLNLLVTSRREPVEMVSFRHGLMEEVIYNNLPGASRREWHARVGEVLEDATALIEVDAATLAQHFDLGERPEKAGRYSLLAGEQAQDMFDYALALEHYQTAMRHLAALPLDESWEILTRLRLRRGRIFLEQARLAELESDIREVQRVAQRYDDGRSVIKAGVLDAERYLREGDYAQVARVTGAVAQLAAEEELREEMADALRLQGIALHALGQKDEALGVLRTALTLAHGLVSPALAGEISAALGRIFIGAHAFRDALPFISEAEEQSRAAHDLVALVSHLTNKGLALKWLGRHREAIDALSEVVHICTRSEQPLPKAYALNELGSLHCWLGEYGEAQRALGEAARIFKQQEDEEGQAWLALTLGSEYDLDAEDLTTARANLLRGIEWMRESPQHEALGQGLLALARVDIEENNLERAEVLLAEAEDVIETQSLHWYRPTLYSVQAQLALAQDDPINAQEFAQSALEAIDRGGNPYAWTIAYRLLALASVDSPDVADRYFKKAIAQGRHLARHIDLAQTLEAAGNWLVEQPKKRQQRRGHKLLKEAAQLYEAMGLQSKTG